MRGSVETSLHAPKGVALRGLWFDALTEAQCVDYVMQAIRCQQGGWIITVNLDHLRRTASDRAYKQLTDQASLRVCDGVPLLWAARLQGTALPGQVAGSNLVYSLAEAAAGRCSLYLLGGDPTTAERAAVMLKERYPTLEVVGTECPPMGFEHDETQLTAMRKRLQEARPDIVYVALGSPKQERLIQELRAELPETWWIGVGISFSFITGDVVRAPRWLQRCGLEWVHRLFQEPRRLFRRYVIEGLPFALRLLTASFLCRFRPGCRDSKRRT